MHIDWSRSPSASHSEHSQAWPSFRPSHTIINVVSENRRLTAETDKSICSINKEESQTRLSKNGFFHQFLFLVDMKIRHTHQKKNMKAQYPNLQHKDMAFGFERRNILACSHLTSTEKLHLSFSKLSMRVVVKKTARNVTLNWNECEFSYVSKAFHMHRNKTHYTHVHTHTLTCTQKKKKNQQKYLNTNLLEPGTTSATINSEDNESLIRHDLHNILQLCEHSNYVSFQFWKKGRKHSIWPFFSKVCMCVYVC